MGQRGFLVLLLFAAAVLVPVVAAHMSSKVWWEQGDPERKYDLTRFRVLILLGDDFDSEETFIIKSRWESWGAEVDIAGLKNELTGHVWKQTDKGWDSSEKKSVKVNLLLSEVDIGRYHALFLPGGKSPQSLLDADSSGVVIIIRSAADRGIILAAICHGPKLLAVADVIRNRKVTGHAEIRGDLKAASGDVVNRTCVVDGNIITGNWPYFESIAVAAAERLLYPEGNAPSKESPFLADPLLRAIKERRSIRKFQEKDVDNATVKILLEAATWAPSANNDQPWKFVIVRDKRTKAKIGEALSNKLKNYYESRGIPLESLAAYWANIFAAPVHIIAFCDTHDVEIEKEWGDIQMTWCMQGVSCACQNILLAAKSQGLGSLWIGLTLTVEDEIRKILLAPGDVRLAAVIAVGYPAEEPLPRIRQPLSQVTFREHWNEE